MISFIEPFQSVVLGSVDAEGAPFGSYAPFCFYEGRYFIFISDVATHAKNIQRTPRASLLFIEDEAASANIFARKRLSLQCRAEVIGREIPLFETVMECFEARFGAEMIGMLRQMADFNLYALTPYNGEATFGFGEAYTVGGEKMDTLIPRRGGGHRKA